MPVGGDQDQEGHIADEYAAGDAVHVGGHRHEEQPGGRGPAERGRQPPLQEYVAEAEAAEVEEGGGEGAEGVGGRGWADGGRGGGRRWDDGRRRPNWPPWPPWPP